MLNLRTVEIARRWWLTISLIGPLALGALRLHGADCDLNGIADAVDIDSGVSEDCNNNGIPDLCEFVPLSFGTVGEPFGLRGEPEALTAADVDGDGVLEVIVGASSSRDDGASTLTVFFRDRPAVTLESPRLSGLAAADLDSDGDVDLLTANGDFLAFYSGDGTGEFGTPLELAVSSGTEQLVVADVDFDGSPDVVTRNPGRGSVTWHRNLGPDVPADQLLDSGRTFALLEPAENVSLGRLFLVATDFDGDLDPDLALAGGPDLAVTILENRERGASFTVTHSWTVGLVTAFTVGDVDGDDFLDIVVGTQRGILTVWRSQQRRAFEETATFRWNASSVTLVDVDDDAHVDLIATGSERAGKAVQLFRGRGEGTFHPSQSFSLKADLVWADDLDADVDIDLAVAGSDHTTILLQGERGGLVLEGAAFAVGSRPHYIDLGHFNDDGKLDVLTTGGGPPHISFGRGDGALERAVTPNLTPHGASGIAVDLDEDGLDDVVLRGGRKLIAHHNRGDGDFDAMVLIPTTRIIDTSRHLGEADVDGDGHVDILAPGIDGLAIHYGDGRGGLGDARILGVGVGPWGAAAGDLDADGDHDLVTANNLSSDLSILLQQASRSFLPRVNVPVVGRPHGVALSDFDLDGDLDVVTANQHPDDVAVFLNPGDGLFGGPAHRVALGRAPRAVLVADLDRDGFGDVVTTDIGLSSISVLAGRGDGTLSRVRRFGPGDNPRLAASGDLDGDGDLDLVVAHRNGSNVFVLSNQSAGALSPEEFLTTVCTALDFERVSVPDGAAFAERRSRFVLPAHDDPALLPSLFINVARSPDERQFLREVFPERFGDLSVLDFAVLALRRAQRDYFTGSLRRLRLEDGSVAYGFDVRVDAANPDELLSREATRQVFVRLRGSFGLAPLVYLPTSTAAKERAGAWDAADLPVVIVEDEPLPMEPEAHPTFLLDIREEVVLCGVFAVAGADRGAREERELKSVVRLRAGEVVLPTEDEIFPGELVEELLFGPELARGESLETGKWRVVRIPSLDGDVTTYRFTYAQPFTLADGHLLELEVVSPLLFRAQGEEPLTERQTLTEDFFVALKGREPLQARLDGAPLVRYGSCTYAALPLWDVEAELADGPGEGGAVLRLQERFEEAASLDDTGPASLVWSEVRIGGERRVVADYERLVYSASRHNTAVDYWVVLDPPLAIAGVGDVHVVELRAPEETLPELSRGASAAYLDAGLQVLGTPQVTRLVRTRRVEAPFLRGDASGDGEFNIVDTIQILRFVFERDRILPCRKAADANDDDRINIIDPIVTVLQLFGRREQLPAPFPNCGSDPTEDTLTCSGVTACR
jgi:hypothetical protein